MGQQIPLPSRVLAVDFEKDAQRDDRTHEVTSDIAYRRLAFVNVAFLGELGAGDGEWVLVDAGLPGTRGLIKSAATARFGDNIRPAAIVLTHGHFDHVGALPELAREWEVPVYAHPLEHPYLNGTASYPEGDPSVGGGTMARLARLYPRGPIELGDWLRPLPEDGTIPHLPDWRWIHTPGHSVGHVSLWRPGDRVLLAGDAIATTAQETMTGALFQPPEMHGPPTYYTCEWDKAHRSVQKLAGLDPEIVLAGHGRPMRGAEMRLALERLSDAFGSVACPHQGFYLDHPARAEDGTAYQSVG